MKSAKQMQQYQQFLNHGDVASNDTRNQYVNNFIPSDSIAYEEVQNKSESERVIQKPLHKKIKRWLKNNVISAIIVALLVGVGGFLFKTAVRVESFNARLDYIEDRMSTIEVRSINNQSIDKEIDNLRKELTNLWQVNLKDIENRINLIEYQISQ